MGERIQDLNNLIVSRIRILEGGNLGSDEPTFRMPICIMEAHRCHVRFMDKPYWKTVLG